MTINTTRGTTHLCDLGIILVIYFIYYCQECVRKSFAPFFKMTFLLFPLPCADLEIFMLGWINPFNAPLDLCYEEAISHIVEHWKDWETHFYKCLCWNLYLTHGYDQVSFFIKQRSLNVRSYLVMCACLFHAKEEWLKLGYIIYN